MDLPYEDTPIDTLVIYLKRRQYKGVVGQFLGSYEIRGGLRGDPRPKTLGDLAKYGMRLQAVTSAGDIDWFGIEADPDSAESEAPSTPWSTIFRRFVEAGSQSNPTTPTDVSYPETLRSAPRRTRWRSLSSRHIAHISDDESSRTCSEVESILLPCKMDN